MDTETGDQSIFFQVQLRNGTQSPRCKHEIRARESKTGGQSPGGQRCKRTRQLSCGVVRGKQKT